jgi:hypothetical protein
MRAKAPKEDQASPNVQPDPEVAARLADLERELHKARAARERARRAASEAAADGTRRPSDEELGYVTTDDSFSKILADARSELSARLGDARDQRAGRRFGDVIEELAGKLKRDPGPGSGK